MSGRADPASGPERHDIETALAAAVPAGARVALGDGCGTPFALHAPLSRIAAARPLSALLGWLPAPVPNLDLTAFTDVRVLMGGPGSRATVEAGIAHLVPARLSALPSLLRRELRPDVLLATLVRGPAGLHFGSEVSYQRGLVEAGVPVVGIISNGTPFADAGRPLPEDAVTVVGECDDGPTEISNPPPTETDRVIARTVAALVPEGARVQVGPGRLAAAIAATIDVPVRVDSGLLPDPVVDLDARGLLIGEPISTYLCGTRRLYDWANGRPLLHPLEHTHDPTRLSSSDPAPLIALNAALEIDLDGQVNVEGTGQGAVGMIGGHPDFATAGVRGDGLSVIALASSHRGVPTLVDRLSRPVTTPSHDIDIVVTERGAADLRGLDRPERRIALAELWAGEVATVGDLHLAPSHSPRS